MGRVTRALGEEHEDQKLLCLEGLIGAGKTTLINELRRTLDFYFVTEPVLQWQRQIDSRSLLGNLYTDFHRWSYTFQVNSVLTRAQAIATGRTTAVRYLLCRIRAARGRAHA